MATKDKLVSLEVLKSTTQADVNDLKSAFESSLKSFDTFTYDYGNYKQWFVGAYNIGNGEITTPANRVRTLTYNTYGSKNLYLTVKTGYKCAVVWYSSSEITTAGYKGYSLWHTPSNSPSTIVNKGDYFAFFIGKSDDSNITDISSIPSDVISFHIDTLTGIQDDIHALTVTAKPNAFHNGIVSSMYSSTSMYAQYKSDGFEAVRFSAKWEDIETTQGSYDWTALDAKVNAASSNGLKMVITLTCQSPVYGNTVEPITDAQKTAWYAFVVAVAQRYAERNITYLIWNEPWNTTFWNGTVAQFVEIANGASMRIHAVKGGTTAVGGLGVNQFSYDIINSNGIIYFDYVDIHVYDNSVVGANTVRDFIAYINKKCQDNRLLTPKFMISEIGYSTKNVTSDSRKYWLGSALIAARYLCNVEYAFVYCDITPETGDDPENYYGIYDSNGDATTTTNYLKTIAQNLNGAQFIGYNNATPINHAFLFKRSNGTYFMAYYSTSTNTTYYSEISGGYYLFSQEVQFADIASPKFSDFNSPCGELYITRATNAIS